MKKLIAILAPIAVVWFLLVAGLAWYLLRDKSVLLGRAPADGVTFDLTPRATTAFAKLTGDNVGRRLAIIVDGQLLTAPVIQSPIAGEWASFLATSLCHKPGSWRVTWNHPCPSKSA